jgi:hypothetical protein
MPPPEIRTRPKNTLDQAVIDEIEKYRDDGDLDFDEKCEPRCHICAEQESRELVNTLITAGLTNREITDKCRSINRRRAKEDDDRIIDARKVWSHRRNHYDTDRTAREIIERRAQERGIDYINGTGHAITPYATIEAVMVKGMQKAILPDEGGVIPSVKETLDAATRLHDLTARDAGSQRMADIMATMDRIISAADKFVPDGQKEAFLAEVEGRQLSKPLAVITERVHEQAEKVVKDFMPPRAFDEGDDV